MVAPVLEVGYIALKLNGTDQKKHFLKLNPQFQL